MEEELMWTIIEKMWEWLSENPTKEKSEWPGWKEYPSCWDDCPCCQYVHDKLEECDSCPATDLWTDHPEDLDEPCFDDPESPYYKWVYYGSFDGIRNAALEISVYAKEKLNKLKEVI